MKKHEKELIQQWLTDEDDTLKRTGRLYREALNRVDEKVRELSAMDQTSSVIYQLNYQKELREHLDKTIGDLTAKGTGTIESYLSRTAEDAYVGTFYDLAKQGIPLVVPFDERQLQAIISRYFKLSDKLYDVTKEFQNRLQNEISRGLASSEHWNTISQRTAREAEISLFNATRIVRTEGHRTREESINYAQHEAKKKGADIVKQWDSSLDGRVRKTHRELDGQIRELDEPFKIPSTGQEAMYPSGFGIASEDINCRCVSLQRARWGLDEDELDTLRTRADYYGLDKEQDFQEFKRTYIKAVEKTETLKGKVEEIREKVRNRGFMTESDVKDAGSIVGQSLKKDYEQLEEVKERNELRKVVSDKAKEAGDREKEYNRLTEEWRKLDYNDPDYRRVAEERAEAFKRWNNTYSEYVDNAEKLKQLEEKAINENMKFTKAKLAEVREVGLQGRSLNDHLSKSRSTVRGVVETAYDCYPTEWIDKSLKFGDLKLKKVPRGYYLHKTWDASDLFISTGGGGNGLATAVHELGHRMESVIPDILDMEKSFYERRTYGEDLKWLGLGYDANEVTRKDNFLSPYMGKDYGGTGYELVSMGFEMLFTRPDVLMKDPDMFDFIMGVLSLV